MGATAPERQHVVIRREEYVAGSRIEPEVGVFTQTHATRRPIPWSRIAAGEKLWMKWSGGPIVASAEVSGFRQLERCTPGELRDTTKGTTLYDLEEYWASRPAVFYGLTIYVAKQRWLDKPFQPSEAVYGFISEPEGR